MVWYTAIFLCFLSGFQSTLLDDGKVTVGFYGESLCPDCIAFANGPLTEAFDKISSIFVLNYVPWGNAKVGPSGEFQCQHGEMECTMNTIEACALHFYPNNIWPFIHCLYGHGEKQDTRVAESCANELNMYWDEIDSCINDSLGYKLELGYANLTSSLQPPHRYTPWITINGMHNTEAEGNGLIQVVCDAYTGLNKPQACKN